MRGAARPRDLADQEERRVDEHVLTLEERTFGERTRPLLELIKPPLVGDAFEGDGAAFSES
jgi:hypothetical protein